MTTRASDTVGVGLAAAAAVELAGAVPLLVQPATSRSAGTRASAIRRISTLPMPSVPIEPLPDDTKAARQRLDCPALPGSHQGDAAMPCVTTVSATLSAASGVAEKSAVLARRRTAVVLEEETTETEQHQDEPEADQPPAEHQPQPGDRGRGGEEQRPPAVWAVEAELSRAILDRSVGAIFRTRSGAAAP